MNRTYDISTYHFLLCCDSSPLPTMTCPMFSTASPFFTKAGLEVARSNFKSNLRQMYPLPQAKGNGGSTPGSMRTMHVSPYPLRSLEILWYSFLLSSDILNPNHLCSRPALNLTQLC